MSTTGILRPDEVVFYHPMDNYTEHTQSQAWSTDASAGFVGGKIGLANSAITGDAPAFGAAKESTASSTQYSIVPGGAIAMLTSTKAVIVYRSDADSFPTARVATISGNDVTLGATKSLYAAGSFQPGVGRISADKFIWGSRYSVGFGAQVCSVSGTDITAGTWKYVDTGKIAKWAFLSSTVGVLMHKSFSPSNTKVANVITISGLDFTIGATATVSPVANNDEMYDVAWLGGQKFAFAWYQTDGSGSGVRARIGTVSGTDITMGAVVVVEGDTQVTADRLNIEQLDTDKFIVSYPDTEGYVKVGAVSGTDITFGPAAQFHNRQWHTALGVMSSTTITMTVADPGGGVGEENITKIGTVSGLSVTFGGATTSACTRDDSVDTVGLSSTSFLTATGGASPSGVDLCVGELGQEAKMTASTPGAYPAATGDDRVVVAMWAKDVTKGSSTVIVQRDYRVELTGTTVTLGPASAVWSGVAALGAGQANDGSEHLLVLDFEHTAGGSWNLSTSLDGAAWVNEGAGTGTRTTSPASADPHARIADGESGQWVDELVMWSGDKAAFDQFTTEELANLNDLADTFGEAMDQYESNYGAPICWQATAVLPDGTVWRDAGCGPCPAVIRVPRGASDIVVTDEGRQVHPRIQEG